MSAEQTLREQVAAANFQHEGEHVVRWLTGGTDPSAHVTFHPSEDGQETITRCPRCKQELGRFDASYGPHVGEQISAIRAAGARHVC